MTIETMCRPLRFDDVRRCRHCGTYMIEFDVRAEALVTIALAEPLILRFNPAPEHRRAAIELFGAGVLSDHDFATPEFAPHRCQPGPAGARPYPKLRRMLDAFIACWAPESDAGALEGLETWIKPGTGDTAFEITQKIGDQSMITAIPAAWESLRGREGGRRFFDATHGARIKLLDLAGRASVAFRASARVWIRSLIRSAARRGEQP